MYISSTYIVKRFILILWILLILTSQATCLWCYQCGSTSDEPCFLDPKQSQFKRECSSFRNEKSTLLISQYMNFSFFSMLPDVLNTGNKVTDDAFYCITLIVVNNNNRGAVRSCVSKNESCEMFADKLKSTSPELVTESCNRCNTDLCNSGDYLNVNFCLLIVLMTISIQF